VLSRPNYVRTIVKSMSRASLVTGHSCPVHRGGHEGAMRDPSLRFNCSEAVASLESMSGSSWWTTAITSPVGPAKYVRVICRWSEGERRSKYVRTIGRRPSERAAVGMRGKYVRLIVPDSCRGAEIVIRKYVRVIGSPRRRGASTRGVRPKVCLKNR